MNKKFVVLLSTAALAMTLMSGCGKTDEQAKPADSSTTQPADQQKPADDAAKLTLTQQFPPAVLPFTVVADATIVEYKGGVVTGKEFEHFLRVISFLNPQQATTISGATKEQLEDYARQYTASRILSTRADEKVKAESKQQAESTFENVKSQYLAQIGGADEKAFTDLMTAHKVTKKDVVTEMTLINNSVNVLKASVKEADVKAAYDKLGKEDITRASVRHILVDSRKRKPEEALKIANDLLARLKKGEDFATLAKEHTEDPGSKETGGLYENANVGDWVPEFKKAAVNQKIGEISDPPVKTDYGYHIIKVEKREVVPFAELKDKLSQDMLSKAYETFTNEELKQQIVKVNIPEVKTPEKK